jgi:23S rRNA (adenine2030-N6)-methyltransferase
VNYRHAFHAGNFADVFKHTVLCRILHYLRGKEAAFRKRAAVANGTAALSA